MKILLLVVGKTDSSAYSQAIDDYGKRINRYLPFDVSVVPDLKNTRNLPEALQREKEGELILKALQPGDYCVLLDERGKSFTSEAFAAYVESKLQTVRKRLVFIIGGPYGFSPEVYAAARERLSLSSMTFSHQMIRLIFSEQLYRAMTILNNEPYHHS
ncbi:MAG: 23S rRNA (pseudouridine(1915)-N(3))-methyltransferase RlmH [Tannerellaceae bacterium]|jgi:23S rRNA (pseudouridine1915-N3)-methyltransferase|nr:23S rRNA (pseudouridine(1915)-N(3))-methyltransferase RlmH [Tannerellaceae bacterium]